MKNTATMKTRACPKCKYRNPVNARYCGKCGYDYRPGEAVADGIRELGRRGWGFSKTSFWLFIGAWVLIFAVLVLATSH